MSATLKLTHKTIGVEIRRGTYDVVVDGNPAGSLELDFRVFQGGGGGGRCPLSAGA